MIARPHSRPGFSLIEVLLAMAILMLSLVAIAQLVGMGSDRSLDARFTMKGLRLAQSKMAEIEAGMYPFNESDMKGEFEGDDSAWKWSCDAQLDDSGATNLYRVELRVWREVRGTEFEVRLGQLMIDPQTMGSAAQAERPPDSEAADPLGMGTMP